MKPAVRRFHHELPLLATYGLQYKKLSIVVSDWNRDANGKKKSLHGWKEEYTLLLNKNHKILKNKYHFLEQKDLNNQY